MNIIKRIVITGLMFALASISMTSCDRETKYASYLETLIQETANDEFPVVPYEDTESVFNSIELVPNESNNSDYIQREICEELRSPRGVISFDGSIIIADFEDNCLVKLNNRGEIIETIGTIGNAKDEFLHPTGLAAHDNKLYVIDSGNSRIKVLDNSFNCVNEIPYEASSEESEKYYTDICVDSDGGIYLSGNYLINSRLLYFPANNNTPIIVAEHFYGCLSESNGIVFAINSGIIYADIDNQEIGARGYKNALYRLDAGIIATMIRLPDFAFISSFVVADESILAISNTYSSIVRINLKDGTYTETVSMLEEPGDETDIKIIDDNISITDGNGIYVYERL